MKVESAEPESFEDIFSPKYLILEPSSFKTDFDKFVVTVFGDIEEKHTISGIGCRLMLHVAKQDTYQECMDYVKKVSEENWSHNKEVAEHLHSILKPEYLKFVMELDR